MSEIKRYDSYLRDGVVHFEEGPEGAWMPSDDVQSELAVLRDELEHQQCQVRSWESGHEVLKQRLADAEHRNAELVGLLRMAYLDKNVTDARCARIEVLISEPTESGASEPCAHSHANKIGCPECGEEFKRG